MDVNIELYNNKDKEKHQYIIDMIIIHSFIIFFLACITNGFLIRKQLDVFCINIIIGCFWIIFLRMVEIYNRNCIFSCFKDFNKVKVLNAYISPKYELYIDFIEDSNEVCRIILDVSRYKVINKLGIDKALVSIPNKMIYFKY